MSRHADSGLATYLKRAARFPRLTPEEEKKVSQDILILHNLRLVVHIAGRYAKNTDELMDFIQEGNLGLIKAAKAYDSSRGRFSVCASLYIRAEIRAKFFDAFGKPLRDGRKCDAVKVPVELGTVGLCASGTQDSVTKYVSLRKGVSTLSPKQQEVINARLEGKAPAEIAQSMQCSRQNIEQISKGAVEALNRSLA